MSNAAAMAALHGRIEKIRTLPLALPEIAKIAAHELEGVIASNIAASRAPDGSAWPATQDGHAPLAHAMSAITVRAVGPEIVVSVDGVEARHHLGRVRGGIARPLIPTRSIPAPMIEALDRVTASVMARHMGGAS